MAEGPNPRAGKEGKELAQLLKMNAGIEDMKRQLDAIVKAMIAPQLGKDDREARQRFAKHVKTELGVRIWNAIDGKRDVGEISRFVNRKPQVVNNYIRRWEQTNPPLVYVYTETSGGRVYKRIYPIRMKPRKQALRQAVPTTPQSTPQSQSAPG